MGDFNLDKDHWGRPEEVNYTRPAYKVDISNPGMYQQCNITTQKFQKIKYIKLCSTLFTLNNKKPNLPYQLPLRGGHTRHTLESVTIDGVGVSHLHVDVTKLLVY